MPLDPYKIDFASLKTLKTVFELKSFTDAALALGVNQSVVSYTIDRLRAALGDQLFLRQAGGIIPTDRCVLIVEEAGRLLDRYENLVAPAEVDPSTIRHTFTLSGNYFEQRWVLPLIVRALRAEAPHVQLTVISAGSSGASQVARGQADLLIGPMRPEGEKFYCRTLLREEYVCIMDPENVLAHVPLTVETYAAARHVLVTYGEGWTSGYLTELSGMGHSLANVPVTVPSPAGIADLISGTDLIGTVPRRFAMMLEPHVRVVACPCPAPFSIDLVWSARTHDSPIHRWFRNVVADVVR